MPIKTNYSPRMFDGLQSVVAVKEDILRDVVPGARKAGQRAGILGDNPVLLVKNKGSEQRRQLSTISAKHLKIGTRSRPLQFTWVGEAGTESVYDAVLFASKLFIRRAPMLSGRYVSSSILVVNQRRVFPGQLKQVLQSAGSDARVYFGPTTAYAAVIEHGFYTRYYHRGTSRRGGIMAWVSKQVKASFGATVACRLVYRAAGYGDQTRGTLPMLEIGVGGSFASNDAVPGRTLGRSRGSRGRR